MSVSAQYSGQLTVTETITTGLADVLASNNVVQHAAWNKTITITGTYTASFVVTLSGGAFTIDLTSLTGTNGASISLSGLKVLAFLILVPNTNANPFTIAKGAANGYQLKGASWNEQFQPGDHMVCYPTNAPTVGGSAKNIDCSGTGSQTAQIVVVGG
jgi:hypothetical protein